MSPEQLPRTFISYSHQNREFTTRLTKELKREGFPIWFDGDIPAGSRWDDAVEDALSDSSIFLIILTPDAIESENVKDEIGYAIDHDKRILPILLEECEIPFRLRRYQYVDFTKLSYNDGVEKAEDVLRGFVKEMSPASAATLPPNTPAPGTFKLNPIMIGSAAFVGIAILVTIFLLSGRDRGAAQVPGATPTVQQAAIAVTPATNTPVPTTASSTATPTPPEPTQVPDTLTPEPQPFFTEDFSGDLSSWSTFVTSGDINKLRVNAEDGKMVFNLSDANSDLFGYSIFNDFTYTDVKLDAIVTNRGQNFNNVSLVCRYSDAGWYEFNVGNDGVYNIFAYDSIIKYDPLADGGARSIKTGQATNKYTAICKGNTLSLWINDVEVRTITVSRYSYDRGKIGLSVSSFRVLPIKVEFDSLTISKP